MKTAWFKPWGWFYRPVAWPGWLAFFLTVLFCLQVLRPSTVIRIPLPTRSTAFFRIGFAPGRFSDGSLLAHLTASAADLRRFFDRARPGRAPWRGRAWPQTLS